MAKEWSVALAFAASTGFLYVAVSALVPRLMDSSMDSAQKPVWSLPVPSKS